MTSTSLEAAQFVVPTSRDEAVKAFGDGAGVTVFGGGTILMPEINYGRLRPARVLMLRDAGLAGIGNNGSGLTIGAMTTVAELEHAPEPLGSAARNVADHEIRAQATLGGNLCARSGGGTPRG
ncbi:MAG: FAD binding domain-containing protein, partial [Gaiellaceae bacterium]